MNTPDDRALPGPGDALVVVDVQNDFLPGGALGIRGGDEIVPVLNRYLERFHELGLPIFATRDWHPADHCSFAAQGGPWPVHCVAGTPGAEFAPGLRLPPGTEIIDKATRRDREAYSTLEGTDLEQRLRAAGVDRLFIGGLAFEQGGPELGVDDRLGILAGSILSGTLGYLLLRLVSNSKEESES